MARRRRRKVFFTGDPNGLQPGDDVGNRIKKQAQRMPPDDIGNRKSDDPEHIVPPDDLGNRIDANPTHEMSGIVWGNVDPKSKGAQRRRRLKSGGPAQRIGRYFAGGVNPMVSGDASRAQEAQEGDHKRRREQRQQERASNKGNNGDVSGDDGSSSNSGNGGSGSGSGGGKRKKRFDQVDGHQALEVNRRRAQRFFEFEEDDRFKYSLKTPAADKRKDSEQCVQRILDEAGRDATATATLLPDGDRPKVLVTIDDRGPSPDVPEAKRSKDAADPLFPMGSGTLMSLNYLVNKIVNRYPDDRIRLAILPADEEKNYIEALEAHIKGRKEAPSDGASKGKDGGANGKPKARKADDGGDKPKGKAKKADKVEAAPAEAPEAEAAADEEPAEEVEAEAPTKKLKATKKATTATKAAAKKVTKKAPAKKVTKKAATAKKAPAKKVTKKAPTKKVTKKAATATKAPAKKTAKKVAKKAPAKKATKKAAKKAK